jgi:hypothetical protein
MKRFKHSLLLFRINTDKDTVKCLFLFRISLFNYKKLVTTFNLKEVSLRIVIEFHKNLGDEWSGMYRI